MAEKKTIELEITSNLDSAEKSVGNLKSQLRQAQAEVALLSDKFGSTSKEAVNAAQKAAELRDRIGDAKALTDAFNPDAKFKALSGTLTGVAGGFSAITGVMGALGSESKDVEQAILKVQSAMAIASGLQAVGESIDQFRILGTVIGNTAVVQKALTIATAAYNYVNAATTTGLKLLRGAMISTGVGALVVGIGMLIANFDKVKATILKVIPALNNVGNSVMNVVHSITDFIGATSESERAVDRLSSAASKSLKNNEQYLKEHGSQLDEYTKQKIAAKNEYLKLVEEDGANQRAYALELNRKLKKIDDDRIESKKKTKKEEIKIAKKEIQDNSDALLEELNTIVDYEEDARLRKEEREKTAADKQKEINDKKLAVLKEQADKELEIDLASKQAKRNALDTSLNILQQFAGKNKAIALGILAVQKGLAIADIVVNAAKSIGGQAAGYALADANALATLGPVAGSAFVLKNKILLAKGIATTKIGAATSIASILAAGIGSASSITNGGGSTPSGGGEGVGSAPAAPAFNVVGASATNQLAQTIGNQQQQPIKAYVVSNDVTTAQSLDRNIIQSASIG